MGTHRSTAKLSVTFVIQNSIKAQSIIYILHFHASRISGKFLNQERRLLV